MTPRWSLRVGALLIGSLLLAMWLLSAASLQAQTCSPTDTIRLTRQGAALWYLLVDGDTLRHQPGGPPRGFTSEGIAAVHGAALRALTGRTIELHQTFRGRFLGCMPSSPGDNRDTTAVPPAIDSLPPAVPEQPPLDTVAPDPGIPTSPWIPMSPMGRGLISCQPPALCSGDARASAGDSVVWLEEGTPGVATRIGDFFLGFQWGPITMGAPRTRTWWIVAWSGVRADTARVVWSVPVTELRADFSAPVSPATSPRAFTWLLIDPRIAGGWLTYAGPDSVSTPRQDCVHARVVASLTHWAPSDTGRGWSSTGSVGETLAACGVTP